jgi:hypothetical protein
MSRIKLNHDPTRDPNSYPRGHPSGNLAPFLSWALDQTGPDRYKTHCATAKRESVFQPDLEPCAETAVNGRDIGSGKGASIGALPRRRLPSEL